jgi:osmotically-inducible protein OsmY
MIEVVAVEEEILWSPFVDSEDVDVQVNDGRVTLTGKKGGQQ